MAGGRIPTNAAQGLNPKGGVLREQKDRAGFAQADDYALIRDRLATDGAREVLDELTEMEGRNKPFFLWTEMHDLEAFCNAQDRYRVRMARVAKMEDAGEQIPIQITGRDAQGNSVQWAGEYTLLKFAAEERRAAANQLALSKVAQVKVAEDIRSKQLDLLDLAEGKHPDEMTAAELESELAGYGVKITDIASARAAKAR